MIKRLFFFAVCQPLRTYLATFSTDGHAVKNTMCAVFVQSTLPNLINMQIRILTRAYEGTV